MNEAETRAVTGIPYHVVVNQVDTLFKVKLISLIFDYSYDAEIT